VNIDEILSTNARRKHVGSGMDEYNAAGYTIRQPVEPERHQRTCRAG